MLTFHSSFFGERGSYQALGEERLSGNDRGKAAPSCTTVGLPWGVFDVM